jgi:1-deoxy-D-xylulose-5-phosphate reductoisomerase
VMEQMTGWGAAASIEDVFACDAEARRRAGECVRGTRAA